MPNHILVIRLSALGDVAMTVPVLRVVAKTYPEVKLTVLSQKHFQPLFNDIPNIRFLEADIYEEHKGLGLIKLANEAKALGIDAVADLHSVIRSKILRNYLQLRGIKVAAVDKGRTEKRSLISETEKELKPLKVMHERYADVFGKLGMPVNLTNHQFPPRLDLTQRLSTFIGIHSKKAIGIAPFAAYKSKMYPMEMMVEVISALSASENYKLFLFGGGLEEIEKLKQLEHDYTNVTNVAGELTFEEELSLISNLDVMVSMDSGNGHLAAMFEVPVVTLWGVTHPCLGFTPFLQAEENQIISDREKYPLIPTSVYGNKFPKGYQNVMESIPSSVVVKRIIENL